MPSYSPQIEIKDLISPGTIGLIQAVDRFNPSRHLKLKTLAEHRINGALLDFSPHIDPLPRGVRRSRKRRDPMIDALSAGGEVAGHERIAQALGCFVKEVCDAFANDLGIGADLDSRIRYRL